MNYQPKCLSNKTFGVFGQTLSTKISDHKEWLKSADVRKMLGISSGTLQTLRINKTLPYTKIGGTIYYAYGDVTRVLNFNKR